MVVSFAICNKIIDIIHVLKEFMRFRDHCSTVNLKYNIKISDARQRFTI